MNASAAVFHRSVPARPTERAAAGAWRAPALTVLAFSALALLAGVRFAALLAHPSIPRVLGVVVAAAACAGALAATRGVSMHRVLATALRVMIVALAAYVSLRAAGAPAPLLWPWRWGRLAHDVGRGLDGLDGLWPYHGALTQARMAVMLALPAVIVPAAALAFWPGARRAAERRVAALALLLGLYVIAAMNESQTGWQVQGMLLLVLLCLWGWAWRPRPAAVGRALTWTLLGAALALAGAGVVRSGRPLIDFRAWNPFGPAYAATTFDWNQVYGPRTWPNSTETMVDVASPTPHLWRATTLDSFDGRRFLRSGPPPPYTSGFAGVTLKARWITHATFTVRGLSSEQLLSPGGVISASIEGLLAPSLAAVAPDGTLSVAGAPPQSGDRYTVTAYDPQPDAAELRAAPRTFGPAFLPYTEFDLPSGGAGAPVSVASATDIALIEASPYARVYALARRLGTGAPSTYAIVARIEAFLRHGFTYDEDPPQRPYPLVSFLLADHVGYCQQFSGAMTLMLRMDGVPARVAAGFLTGSRDPATGSYEVTAQDAHAWVEVFFEGIGWVPFDPTPHKPSASSSDALPGVAGASSQALRHRAATRRRRRRRAALAAAATGSRRGSGERLEIGLAAAVALLLVSVWWIGTLRIARALEGDADGAVRELSRALTRVGLPISGPTTLVDLERRLENSYGAGASHYVRLLRERRFAPRADPRRPSAHDRRRLRRALSARSGPLARLGILLALPPGTRRPQLPFSSRGAARSARAPEHPRGVA